MILIWQSFLVLGESRLDRHAEHVTNNSFLTPLSFLRQCLGTIGETICFFKTISFSDTDAKVLPITFSRAFHSSISSIRLDNKAYKERGSYGNFVADVTSFNTSFLLVN